MARPLPDGNGLSRTNSIGESAGARKTPAQNATKTTANRGNGWIVARPDIRKVQQGAIGGEFRRPTSHYRP
ncbi:MAG: hypothetical protein AAFX06_32365, partial [Planctomycetota bacterium]